MTRSGVSSIPSRLSVALRDDLRVGVAFASAEAHALAPCLGVDNPPGDAEEAGGFGAVKPGVHVSVARAGVEAVDGDRHLCGNEGHS